MKKKGLIISTVVMVVVLIASLTTATYAWFSVSASATINNISINTQASDGLVIASYDPSAADLSLYSGSVTATNSSDFNTSGNKYWGATDATGFGTELTLEADESGRQIANLYAASGDGTKLYMNSADQQALVNQKPENVVLAKENVNYFVLDFILQSTAGSNGKLYIKQLNIDPGAIKANMAGAVRIALFAKAQSDVPTKVTEWTVADDGKLLYDPYGAQKLNNGVWQTGNDIDTMKYVTGAGPYADNLSAAGAFKTAWGEHYFVPTITGTAVAPATKLMGGNDGYADLAAAKVGSTLFEIGELGACKFITLRAVIWFEGEDSACVQASAGGGIGLTLNFGLEVTAG